MSKKKDLFKIISNGCIDENIKDNVMEINVNKISFNQLKQLEKFVNQCNKENNSGISSSLKRNLEFQKSKMLEDEKENNIMKNDDLSSCLSDEDDDEDE